MWRIVVIDNFCERILAFLANNTISHNATAAAVNEDGKNPNRIQMNAMGELTTIVMDAIIL